jgi:NADPH:quinone reductase-like Zn-dependent oxidoreductase
MARALTISARGESPTVTETPSPEPGPGQVRVAVQAASVNGIDAYVAAGYVWDSMPHRFPVVLGRDFAGTVEAVGTDVTSVRVGDLVAGVVTGMDLYLGVIAEHVVVDEDGVVAVPDGVTAVQAAALGLAGVSARDMVDALSLTTDDVVLVSGATGGVGALAVQLAAATGATVLATARPDATEFVRGLGAHTVVDHTEDLAAAVAAAAPDGVTAVAHAAGDAAALAKTLRPGGRLASLLGATAEQVGRDDITVTPVGAQFTPEKLRALLDAVAAGQLRVPVGQTFSLEEATQALGAFGEPKQGKLVITLD